MQFYVTMFYLNHCLHLHLYRRPAGGHSRPKTLRMSVEVLRSPSPRPPAIVLKNLRMITRHTF